MDGIEELLKSGRPVLLTNAQLREIFKGRPRQVLMTMRETGEYLGCSRWHVQHLIRQKAFPYIASGRRNKWIDVRDVDKWIDRTKQMVRA